MFQKGAGVRISARDSIWRFPPVRPSEGVPHDYDVVIGPTADDNTNRALKFYYDGAYGNPSTDEAKKMLLHVLEVDKLGMQFYVSAQGVADRLIKKFESIDWRSYT